MQVMSKFSMFYIPYINFFSVEQGMVTMLEKLTALEKVVEALVAQPQTTQPHTQPQNTQPQTTQPQPQNTQPQPQTRGRGRGGGRGGGGKISILNNFYLLYY